MSDYSCGTCHNYVGHCICYHHHRGKEESIAWEYYQRAYKKAEDEFRDYMRGYSMERGEGYSYDRVPVNTLDLVALRDEANRLEGEYDKIHAQKMEEGRALHEARKVKDKQFSDDVKKKAAARERVIERLIEEEMQNEV